jgi:Ca-activated chloride channel family protein
LRQLLRAQRLPAPATIRPIELLNAFRYRSPATPAPDGAPLAATLEVGDTPWAPARKLVRIGVHGREVDLSETRQSLVDGLARTAATIARDVRIQVEFNPTLIAGYRLVGSSSDTLTADSPSTHLATAEQFFSGQGFCALFELVPAPAADPALGSNPNAPASPPLGGLLTVHLQFLPPEGGTVRTLDFSLASVAPDAPPASADFRLAAAVAEFALVLRSPPADGAKALRGALRGAETAVADTPADPAGQRAEFLSLVKLAQTLLE